MPKTMKAIWNLLTTVLVTLVVLLAILLAGVRVFGLTPFAVLSGSMEPSYRVGSLIYVKKVPPESIQVGDPITFVLNEDLVIATHRVVEIDSVNSFFITKGDANDTPDAMPVHFQNLIGKPVFTVPRLGYVASALSSPKGMILAGTAGIVLLILVFIPDLLKKAEAADARANVRKAPKHPEV